MNSSLKLLLEIVPLLVFFGLYKQYDIIYATAGVVIATIIAQLITYFYERKFSAVQLVATGLLAIFGSITIFSGDSTFIKLKPTIINLVFASILFFGTLRKKGLLKFVFGNAIEMSEKNWIILSRRWSFFFLLLAMLNELVWRNFSEEFWVNFKVFGILGLTFLFLLTQMTFLHKNNTKSNS
jgi:intracellular septation protein